MAVATNDTYTAASGATIYGGREGPSVPNDVEANVWTPTKDASGDILAGSWANLPLDEWCTVSGVTLRQIADQLDGAGINRAAYDFGTSNGTIAATLTPWTGIAVDQDAGDVWFPRGGGHADSSMNGVWRLNLERMGDGDGFTVEHVPSNPDTSGSEWSAEYRSSGNFTLYQPYTQTTFDRGDILPDGEPTSSHTYAGVWFDPRRKKVGTTRYSRWQFDTVGKTWERALWPEISGSQVPQIYSLAHWDHLRDRVLLFSTFASGSPRWYAYDDADQSTVPVSGPSMSGFHEATYVSAQNGSDIWLIAGSTSGGERWARMDLQSLSWVDAGAVGNGLNYDYTWDSCGCCYVPQWHKIIHVLSKAAIGGERIRRFDCTAKTMESWSPAGNAPLLGAGKWISNKIFYYARRKCVIVIDPSSGDDGQLVHVMRVG